MSDGWFSRGKDDYNKKAEEQKKRRSPSQLDDPVQFRRYYIPQDDAGEDKKVYVVDNDPCNAYVHRFPVDGIWSYRLPCPVHNGGYDDRCVLCEVNDGDREGKASPATVYAHYTIVDIDGWVDDDNNRHMDLQALEANEDVNTRFAKHEDAKGPVDGTVWDVTRLQKSNSSSIGGDWMHVDDKDHEDFVADNFDALKRTLTRTPEEWGYYEGEGDDLELHLHALPWDEILEAGLMKYGEQEEYLDELGYGIFTRSGGSSGGGGSDSDFDNTDEEGTVY